MIINTERNPVLSLYYLGSEVIEVLSSNKSLLLDDLYNKLKKRINKNIHIDFFYYTLDWLYMQSLIELQDRKVIYVNRKINSTQNET